MYVTFTLVIHYTFFFNFFKRKLASFPFDVYYM